MERYKETESVLNEETDEEDEEIIDNDYSETFELKDEITLDSRPKILSFLSEYMALPLSEKISQYSLNNEIRYLTNPITLDTLLHYLCMNNDNYLLIKLIKPTLTEIESKNNIGLSLLHIAIKNKSYKIAEYLIENGANIQTKDYNDNTPLHTAISLSDIISIHLLIVNNAKIDCVNKNNETPLDIAKKKYDENYVKYLRDFLYLAKNYTFSANTNNLSITNNKSTHNISSFNNCSFDTKNETKNISPNIYMKKIVSKEKSPIRNIHYNKTNIVQIRNNRTPDKQHLESFVTLSPYGINKSILNIKRNTKPETRNEILIEARNENEGGEIADSSNSSFNILKFQNFQNKNIYSNNISTLKNNYTSENLKKTYKKFTSSYKLIDGYVSQTTCNVNINRDILEKNNEGEDNIVTPNISRNNFHPSNIKTKRKIPDKNSLLLNIKKEISCKEQLLKFLKQIGMQNYGNILISEGFDDINLIIKQMSEGFPMTDDTLKEIGIISLGDRTKILIRIQEISDGFEFDIPFEQVYFGNSKSIEKYLEKLNMSKYYENFLNAGYSSIELLLIQMASKFKLNEKILEKELLINDEEDRKKILKYLNINSKKYVAELIKKSTVKRTYSRMVHDTGCNCLIM